MTDVKPLLYALIAMAISGCGVSFDAETRLVANLQFRKPDGEPAASLPVRISASDGLYTERISTGTTNANGLLRLVFPAAEGDATYILNIDEDETAASFVGTARLWHCPGTK
jgi:hypothetical protein